MFRRPRRSTLRCTLFPYTELFRSTMSDGPADPDVSAGEAHDPEPTVGGGHDHGHHHGHHHHAVALPADARAVPIEIAPGVVQLDTLLGGWAQVTAGYLLPGTEPGLVDRQSGV